MQTNNEICENYRKCRNPTQTPVVCDKKGGILQTIWIKRSGAILNLKCEEKRDKTGFYVRVKMNSVNTNSQ